MSIPGKAIIHAPTEQDAKDLFSLLGEYEYKFSGQNAKDIVELRWGDYRPHRYGVNTCFSLHSDKTICYSPMREYQQYCEEFDAYGGNGAFIPEDDNLRFIHVWDFIMLCNGEQTVHVENETLLSLL